MRTFLPAAKSTILFEGDSLTNFRGLPTLDTWAWCRLTGAHYGYPERVGDWIFCQRPELELQVRNGAIGGAIMTDVLSRFEQNVLTLKPSLVFMTIGTNDTARGIAPEAVSQAMATFCRRLAETCQGRVIHLGGRKTDHGADHDLGQRRQAMMTAIAQTVRAHGGMSLDVMSVLLRQEQVLRQLWQGHTIFHDGTHLNPVGHEIMANIVLRALGLLSMPGVEPPADLT